MRKYCLMIFILSSFLIGCSCNSLPIESLNTTVNGKNIIIQKGEKFLLILDAHSDGGYQWDCQISDSKIIKKDSTQIISNNKNVNMVGGISTETLYFSGNNVTGESEITLIEHRSWEKNIPPVNKVQFQVLVK